MSQEHMTIKEFCALLQQAPEEAILLCGVDGFTLHVVSSQEKVACFEMMFIGMKGSSPIHVPMQKHIDMSELSSISRSAGSLT